ncbi:MAG: DUF1778 domain-containing protein [Desulfobacterales bacterium]
MPLSLRIPAEKEKMIVRAAERAGKTKSAYIIEAIDEKLGLGNDYGRTVREMAGWLSHDEAGELRESMEVFNRIDEEDWV